MLRSLAARLTFAYTAFVLLVVTIAVGVLTQFAFTMLGHNISESINNASEDVQRIVREHAGQPFATIDAAVSKGVKRSNVRIRALTRPPGVPALPVGPFNPQNFGGIAVGGPPPPDRLQDRGPGPAGARDAPYLRTFERERSGERSLWTRFLYLLGSAMGIRVAFVSAGSGAFVIVPDPDRLGPLVGIWIAAMLGVIFGALIIAWLAGRYITRQALAPLAAVTGALQQFASGDFTPQPIAAQTRDEIGTLALAYNGAAQQVAAAFDERRRVETYMRQFIADAGHELRTPLTVIMGYLQVLQRGALGNPELSRKAFATLDFESRRMKTLIDRLIVLARLERPEPATPTHVDVAAVARRAVDALDVLPNTHAISLRFDADAVATVEESELYEAIANLIDNARKYGGGTPIDIDVQHRGRDVIVRVSDRGPGIPEADRAHVFERFYRGEDRGEIEGSGLGLAIAHQAVARAHGSLSLVDAQPGRTTFEIRLPSARQRELVPSPAALG